jgi:hypothetical protein
MLAEAEGESNPAHAKQILLQAITHYHQKGNLGEEARAWQRLADMYFSNTKFNDNAAERIGHLLN